LRKPDATRFLIKVCASYIRSRVPGFCFKYLSDGGYLPIGMPDQRISADR
jgi:hypothetical protein